MVSTLAEPKSLSKRDSGVTEDPVTADPKANSSTSLQVEGLPGVASVASKPQLIS